MFSYDAFKKQRSKDIKQPTMACGFCQAPLETFQAQSTPHQHYTRCSNEQGCAFFTKTDDLSNYHRILLTRVSPIYKALPPYCQHRKYATLSVSRSAANFKRPFFRCSYSKDCDPCNYFQWGDEDLPNKKTCEYNEGRSTGKDLPKKRKQSSPKKDTTITKVTILDVDGEPRRFHGNLMLPKEHEKRKPKRCKPGLTARYQRNELSTHLVDNKLRYFYHDWMIPDQFVTDDFINNHTDVLVVSALSNKKTSTPQPLLPNPFQPVVVEQPIQPPVTELNPEDFIRNDFIQTLLK